jgi:hypothetical protein
VPKDARPSIRKRKAYWPCVCDCGRKKRVRGAHLLTGSVVSCGCWRADGEVRKAARRKAAAGDQSATIARITQQAAWPGSREMMWREDTRRKVAAFFAEIRQLFSE